MKQEDLLKCPLLQGLDAMHRAELLGLINDSGLKEKLEQCMAQHVGQSPQPVKADWKATETPLWRRSEKE